MPTIIGKFSIDYEMITPKSVHDVTTPTETELYSSLASSFELLYLLNSSSTIHFLLMHYNGIFDIFVEQLVINTINRS